MYKTWLVTNIRPVPRDRTKLRKQSYKYTQRPSHVLYILLAVRAPQSTKDVRQC